VKTLHRFSRCDGLRPIRVAACIACVLSTAAVAAPPILVHSSNRGVAVRHDTLLVGWTAAPNRVNTSNINSTPDNWYWTTPDFSLSVPDDGTPCPFDEGWSFRVSFSNSDTSTVTVPRSSPLHFTATSIQNQIASGTWLGPADWTLDGSINSTDFLAFLTDFFAGHADFTLDGITDSQDFFDFLNWFLGPD